MSKSNQQSRLFSRKPPAPDAKLSLARAIDKTVEAGAARYERNINLPELIGINPGAVAAAGQMSRELVVAKLERALGAERRRAKAGHWAYDLNRHIALRQALIAERNGRKEPNPK